MCTARNEDRRLFRSSPQHGRRGGSLFSVGAGHGHPCIDGTVVLEEQRRPSRSSCNISHCMSSVSMTPAGICVFCILTATSSALHALSSSSQTKPRNATSTSSSSPSPLVPPSAHQIIPTIIPPCTPVVRPTLPQQRRAAPAIGHLPVPISVARLCRSASQRRRGVASALVAVSPHSGLASALTRPDPAHGRPEVSTDVIGLFPP